MRDGWKGALVVILICVYFIVATGFIAYAEARENEREYACVALGYDGYDRNYDACSSGENPIMVYPYETVFDRIE